MKHQSKLDQQEGKTITELLDTRAVRIHPLGMEARSYGGEDVVSIWSDQAIS